MPMHQFAPMQFSAKYIHAAWLQDIRMVFPVWTPKVIQIECMYVGYLDNFQKFWHDHLKKYVPLLVEVGNLKTFTF